MVYGLWSMVYTCSIDTRDSTEPPLPPSPAPPRPASPPPPPAPPARGVAAAAAGMEGSEAGRAPGSTRGSDSSAAATWRGKGTAWFMAYGLWSMVYGLQRRRYLSMGHGLVYGL